MTNFKGEFFTLNKEKIHINVSTEMGGFLSFTEKFYSTIHALTVLFFTCNRHNKLTVNLPSLITVEFLWLIEPQFTVFKMSCT